MSTSGAIENIQELTDSILVETNKVLLVNSVFSILWIRLICGNWKPLKMETSITNHLRRVDPTTVSKICLASLLSCGVWLCMANSTYDFLAMLHFSPPCQEGSTVVKGPIHSHNTAPTRLAGTKIRNGWERTPARHTPTSDPQHQGGCGGVPRNPHSRSTRESPVGGAPRGHALPSPMDPRSNQPSRNDIVRVHGALNGCYISPPIITKIWLKMYFVPWQSFPLLWWCQFCIELRP